MSYQEQSAEEIVRRYWREYTLIRTGRYLLAAVYLYLLWRLAAGSVQKFWIWTTIYLALLASFFLCLRLVRWVNSRHYLKLEDMINQECDAVKNTEVCRLLGCRMKRSTGMVRLNEAKGLVFSGRFREAAALLDEVELKKPDLAAWLIRQNVAFNCALGLGELRHAEDLRQETERLIEKSSPEKPCGGRGKCC